MTNITIISRKELENNPYCPICTEDKDYKLKRKTEGKFIVFICPNCETRYEFNKTIEDILKMTKEHRDKFIRKI